MKEVVENKEKMPTHRAEWGFVSPLPGRGSVFQRNVQQKENVLNSKDPSILWVLEVLSDPAEKRKQIKSVEPLVTSLLRVFSLQPWQAKNLTRFSFSTYTNRISLLSGIE